MTALAAQLRSQRTRKCEVTETVSIAYLVPSSFRISRIVDALRDGDGDEVTRLMLPALVDMAGMKESDIQPPGVGADVPIKFDRDVVEFILADRPQWVTKLAMHMVDSSTELNEQRKAVEGN